MILKRTFVIALYPKVYATKLTSVCIQSDGTKTEGLEHQPLVVGDVEQRLRPRMQTHANPVEAADEGGNQRTP